MARFNKMYIKKLFMPDSKNKNQLDKMSQVTATASELNIMDGVTATATELNTMDGITSTVTELNLLDGATGSTEQLSGGRTRIEVTATGSLTSAQVRNTIITNYGMASAGDITLPAYVGSTTCTIITEAASKSWSFKPPSGETFVLDGTALDADDEIDVGQVVGDMAQLVRIRTGASTYQWHYLSSVGTHSDGGAS